MDEALVLAREAGARGEVPVGASVVRDGVIVGRGGNAPIAANDPTAHAEISALREAANAIGNYRLPDCEMYVTLEPCPMCAGAMMNSGIGHWVMGGRLKAVGRAYGQYSAESFVKFVAADVEITTGILAEECEALRNRYMPS